MRATPFIIFLIACLTSTDAVSCGVVESMTFRDHISDENTLAIVRVESLRLRRGEGAENLTGQLRVVETLKGSPAKFKSIIVDGVCNDIRLDVGGYYLIATSQVGSELKVDFGHSWLVDVSLEYQEGMPRNLYSSPLVKAVQGFVSGTPLPADFPTTEILNRSHRFVVEKSTESIAP